MNLTNLFDTQRKLDERIIREKGLEGRDMLPEKILALQVELGECANEWRGFKFWSNDQEPRTYKKVYGTELFEGELIPLETDKNPLLEEYVDCLHFILSIGLDLNNDRWADVYYKAKLFSGSIAGCFAELYGRIASDEFADKDFDYGYMDALNLFLGLGEVLGFTWEQIESAYFEKNAENHKRQDSGY